MRNFITYLFSAIAIFIAEAETPQAYLKAEYEEIHNYHNTKTGEPLQSRSKFILLIGNGHSQYYSPQTFFIDSLKNDPTGASVYDAMQREAFEEGRLTGKESFYILKEKGFMAESRYRSDKDFTSGIITVKNSDTGDRYRYPVEMSDLTWELGDSTKNIMGYDCLLAEADYHGRHWKAWFATEIPVQDGPWQLCGLPGLILEANTDDGDYGFLIKGLQKTCEAFKPDFYESKYFDTKRKSYWKMKDYGQRNRSAQIAAMTKGAVKISEDANFTGTDDFIETDYHE